jgi:hypothetical protein
MEMMGVKMIDRLYLTFGIGLLLLTFSKNLQAGTALCPEGTYKLDSEVNPDIGLKNTCVFKWPAAFKAGDSMTYNQASASGGIAAAKCKADGKWEITTNPTCPPLKVLCPGGKDVSVQSKTANNEDLFNTCVYNWYAASKANESIRFSKPTTNRGTGSATCKADGTWNVGSQSCPALPDVQPSCNNSVYLGCTKGTATNDDGVTSCTSTRRWKCSIGSKSASCSKSNACTASGFACNGTTCVDRRNYPLNSPCNKSYPTCMVPLRCLPYYGTQNYACLK